MEIVETPVISDNTKKILKRQIRKAEVKERIKELYYVRRWPIIDVMRELRVDSRTFNNYLDEIKKDAKDKAPSILKEEIANSVYHSYRNILVECWNVVENAKSDFLKLKALELIHDIEMKNVETLQSVGMLEKPTEKLEMTHKHDFGEMMDKWRELRKKERVIEVSEVVESTQVEIMEE